MQHISQEPYPHEFEYQRLSMRQRTEIRQLTSEIKVNIRTTVKSSWEIGRKLAQARHQLDPFEFSSWLNAEFDWSRRTAYNFIQVYEAFPEFASANFAQLNISVSALYLLAAPSTQPEIRDDFLGRVLAGERISHKVIQATIQSARAVASEEIVDIIPDVDDVSSGGIPIEPHPSQIADSISDNNVDSIAVQSPAASDLYPAWNRIDSEFSLFWGDTTSPQFTKRLPEKALVLAVPFQQWHYDWLTNESRSCLVIAQPKLEQELVESLLSALAASESALILPWLPSWKMIEFVLSLNIKIYAQGHPNFTPSSDEPPDPYSNRCGATKSPAKSAAQ